MPHGLAALAASTTSTEKFASFDAPLWLWGALLAAITTMLVVDLLLVHRTAHVITIKEAAITAGRVLQDLENQRRIARSGPQASTA